MYSNKFFKRKLLVMVAVLLFTGMFIGISPLNSSISIASTNVPPPILPEPGIPFDVPTNGTPITLTPGENLMLETPSGVAINLTVGESVNISVIESSELPAGAGEIPVGAYGLGTYLSIKLNDSSVDVNATLSLPYDTSLLPTNVAEDALYFAFYNASTDEWQGVPSWVDTAEGKVYGETDHFSIWTVLAGPPDSLPDRPEPGVPFEVPVNGTSVELVPGEKLVLTTPSGITVNLTVGVGVTLTINETTFNPGGELPDNVSGIGRYLEIELNDSSVDVEATLALAFSAGEVPSGVAEDALYFAFYNASTGEWEGVPSWVDTDNNVVYANTTHFSIWTVLANTDSDGTSGPSTTSTQPIGSLWFDIENVKDGFVGISLLFGIIFAVALVRSRGKQ